MENKETIQLTIAEAISINNILSEAKFGDISLESVSSLLEFKFELSKVNKDREEYVQSVIDNLKTDRFKELQSKEDKSDDEKTELDNIAKELDKDINEVLNPYFMKTVDFTISKIDKNDFYSFCKTNEFKISVIEYLYNKIVK